MGEPQTLTMAEMIPDGSEMYESKDDYTKDGEIHCLMVPTPPPTHAPSGDVKSLVYSDLTLTFEGRASGAWGLMDGSGPQELGDAFNAIVQKLSDYSFVLGACSVHCTDWTFSDAYISCPGTLKIRFCIAAEGLAEDTGEDMLAEDIINASLLAMSIFVGAVHVYISDMTDWSPAES